MRPTTLSRTGTVSILVLLALVSLVVAGCGGGSSGPNGDRTGEDTLPVILELQTPLGLQGTRGVGANVPVVYQLRDNEFDPADVEVQYGVDTDRSGAIDEGEFLPATPAPGGDGMSNLNASPNNGALHSFIWDSLSDIQSGRYVTQDFDYDRQTGRVLRDNFGEPIFRFFPGAQIRIRPVANGTVGAWRYSDPFDLNNNNRPSVKVGAVDIPDEGKLDSPPTVNEDVSVNWTAIDPDDDPLFIAVDWVSVPAGFDPGSKTTEELADLPWSQATAMRLGVASQQDPSPASPTGVDHKFVWSSVVDAGTVNGWMMLRVRPIDGKYEVGDWFYSSAPFLLDNYTIFTDPISDAEGTEQLSPVADAQATLLRGTALETILVTGGSATDGGDGTDYAALFYPGSSQTTKGAISAIAGGMQKARVGHTATRLLDGRVLIVGGAGTGGAVSDTAEIYDPTTRKFTLLSSQMSTPRRDHVAVLLQSGDVLIAGGRDDTGALLTSAELFRAQDDLFESLNSSLYMKQARAGAEAALLPDGRVLVAGGRGNAGALATVEIYDPTLSPQLGGFKNADVNEDMGRAREGLTLTATVDATYAAVAAGGMASPPTNTLERFDWLTDRWSDSSVTMTSARAYHGAVRLGDGQILLAGGQMNEGGTLTATADVYDPSADTMDLPNGEMNVAVRNAATAIMTKGRPVFFGGLTSSAASDAVQVFTPDGAFNEPPLAQVADMLGSLEPWSFGVRIRWRGIDPEGDPARIVCQYRIKPSTNDNSGSLPGSILDKWLPATMAKQTVLGEQSSGQTALSTRKDFVDTVDDPIDAPDVDPGEHRFVWATYDDIPKGDYDNVFFRIFVYGAEEGTGVESARFSISKNAPVIARVESPLSTWGNIVVPFYLQDADKGELAKLVWEYGVDKNGDGKIVTADGESWETAKHSPVTVMGHDDAGTDDVVSGSKDPDPNNDYTTPGGIPWGKKHYFIWDSVYDIGSPTSARSDLILRVTPYDYPAGSPGDASLGISYQIAGFKVEKDPNGLYLAKWYPSVAGTSSPYEYAGVKLDEPIVFEFTGNVDPASLVSPDGPNAIQVYASGGTLVTGYYQVSGKVVTFYPQVQEIPSRSDTLVGNTGYTVKIHGYDPSDRNHAIVKRLGADPDDTNARNLLIGTKSDQAFKTVVDTSASNNYGMLSDSTAPQFSARVTPSADTGVSTGSKIGIEFDDRLMPGSVGPASFLVVAKGVPGVESVVVGDLTLENMVDENGPGGSLRKYSVLTLTPNIALPPDATDIEIRIGTGLKDLAGNNLAASATESFTTVSGGTDVFDNVDESFDDATNRDADMTTAFWGATDPKNKGSAIGSGTSGKLTGLFDGGSGADGDLDLTLGNQKLTTSSTKKVFNYKSVNIPYGRTLTLDGTEAATIRVQTDVDVSGLIDARGQSGQNGFTYVNSSSAQSGAKGGTAGAGGGAGGNAGSYTYKQTSQVNGSAGKTGVGDSSGNGPGKGGLGATYGVGSSTYWSGGGGGAGHASAGASGGDGYTYYGKKGGAGGKTYGSTSLSTLEAGAGGGAGGSSLMYYTYYSWYGAGSGGGGGGGGGSLMFAANGKISVASTGSILAGGGNGGRAYSTYAGGTTVYPGGGGGGSGGSIFLRANDIEVNGSLDVLGGNGGAGAYTGSYDGTGGDGGDGRIRLEFPGFSGKLFTGKTYTSNTLISTGSGGSNDWKITSDTTIDTDTGKNIPGYLTQSGGKILVKDFVVDAVLTITGSKPFIVEAAGDVEITGRILALGGNGQNSYGSYYGSYSGWFFREAKGGSGTAGGFDGGANGSYTSYSTSWKDSHDGVGTNGKEGGSGSGEAGAKGSPYSWAPSTSYTYRYYYYSGGGGGAGGATAGTKGSSSKYYNSGTYYYGDPGEPGSAVVDGSSLTASNMAGGTGGGGGGNGGYKRDYTSSSSSDYHYSYGPAAGGGGGGGGILVTAGGTMLLSGGIFVNGGNGGGDSSGSYYYFKGPGGGGAGGNVVLQADGGFQFGLITIDAGGGAGGTVTSGTTVYNRGGNGGDGAIVLRTDESLALPADLPKNAKYGDGTMSGGDFTPTKYGVSTWFDTGSFVPFYLSRTLTHNGGGKLWLEGAQTDPITGKPDESNTTGWIDVSGGTLSGLDGYRWVRFRVELIGVSGKYPEVSYLQIKWKYRK